VFISDVGSHYRSRAYRRFIPDTAGVNRSLYMYRLYVLKFPYPLSNVQFLLKEFSDLTSQLNYKTEDKHNVFCCTVAYSSTYDLRPFNRRPAGQSKKASRIKNFDEKG